MTKKIAASAVGIAHQYDRPNENFRDAEAYVARTAGTDDGIVICPTFDWTPFAYYAARHDPAELPTALDGVRASSESFGRGSANIGDHPTTDSVHGSIWVIYNGPSLRRAQRIRSCATDQLLKQRVRREHLRFGALTVDRWART